MCNLIETWKDRVIQATANFFAQLNGLAYPFPFQELFPKLCNVLKDLPCVSKIVVLEEPHKGDIPPLPETVSNVQVIKFSDLIELGKQTKVR